MQIAKRPDASRRATRLRTFRPIAAVLIAIVLTTPAMAVDEVNIYSFRQPFLTEPMFDAFTAETGITVNTVFAKEGLIERLENEGRNSPADLVLVADVGNVVAAVDAGVTQSVDSEVLTNNIPAAYRDPNGHWFGLTNRARLIITSRDRVEPGLVETYADLARPELKGLVCTRSGKHEYMVALIASVIAHEGSEAAETWLTGVKNNLARRPQGNDRAQARAIAEGECDVAVINSYYLGAMEDDPDEKPWVDALNIVFPNQNDRGTHMNISGIVMTAAAPNRENAVKLMEFLAGDTAQQLYADLNHEYPVKQGVARSALVESWGDFKADPLPLSEIAKYRGEATRLVDKVDYDG